MKDVFYKTGIIKSTEGNKVLIEVDMGDDAHLIDKQKIEECEIAFKDGRKISPKQRKYIYGLIKDIAEDTGETNESAKEGLKNKFCIETGTKDFSLSEVDMTTAKDFLNFLVDFCLENEIKTRAPLSSSSETADRFIYACCVHGKCCIYNRPAHIIDVKTMTEEITDKSHVLPLCDKAFDSLKNVGLDVFTTINYITPIKASQSIIDAAAKYNAQNNSEE